MKLFDPDPNLRWLFCLTHPDDEISICAWIRRLASQGNSVHLSWTHSIPVREREARAAALLMEVPSQNLYFHGATDGSVCDEMSDLLIRFEAMVSEVKPDRICCGAFEQGHLDHDATNFLVNQVATVPILEIPFYHTYLTRMQKLNRFSDPHGQEIHHLDKDDQAFKKLIARQYPSQNIWQILAWHEMTRPILFKRRELLLSERMRLQTHRDFLSPQHPIHLASRVRASNSWQRWSSALQRIGADKSRSSVL